jgi:hypothetical protein
MAPFRPDRGRHHSAEMIASVFNPITSAIGTDTAKFYQHRRLRHHRQASEE